MTMTKIMILKEKESGAILLYTLLILIVLSIIGVMGLKTTYFELQLSGNDKCIHKLKLNAGSTAAAAVEIIEKQPETLLRDSNWESGTRFPWFSRGESDQFDTVSAEKKYHDLKDYIMDIANWRTPENSPSNCSSLSPETMNGQTGIFVQNFHDCKFQVIDAEVSQGSSLQTGNNYSNLHNLYITGLSTENNGKGMVQIGYRKRF